jgi:dihydropyrimidinase
MPRVRTTLIREGTVVRGETVSQQDVLIRGEHIAALGDLSDHKADIEIDASGLLVLPGAVDTHVHFNDVFMNTISVHDYYTGTLAAAYGGVTSIIDFSNQVSSEPLMSTLKNKKDEAKGKALVDWGVHPVIAQPTPDILEEIPLLVKEGAPTIKCYLTYREEGLMVEEEDLKRIFKSLRNSGGMLMVHAEDNEIIEENVKRFISSGLTKPIYHAQSRPPEAENRAIRRCLQLAKETGGRLFIVHLASDEGVELIGAARDEGLDVIAETCTHYLVLTDKMLERDDGIKWICSPPLRSQSIQDKLWEGLKDGRISMVTSDDAAYSWEAKLYGAERFDKCPNGIPGIETRLNLLYSEGVAKGRLTLPRFVELVSTIPANLFGLAPQKGSLNPGAEADIVLFDPKAKWNMNQQTLHMATDWSAYENIEITGKIVKTFSRGDLIIEGDRCLAEKGRGRYIRRQLDSLRQKPT